MRVTVTIDSKLRVHDSDLPAGAGDEIRAFLTIPNGAKAKAIKLKQWGAADMDDEIVLWAQSNGQLVMPRGFASVLRAGLEAKGAEVDWDDRTSAPAIPLADLVAMDAPKLRPDQEEAASDILRQRLGILQSPTASGKTVIGLDCWRRSGLRGIVLVQSANLLTQWRDRAREHLGIEAGVIGDGVWEERDLTIAMLQTLYRRRRELDAEGWWARFGFAIVDECHHAIAKSFREIIERLVSRDVLGQTATPLDGQWEQPILTAILGPVIHIVSPDSLRRQGVRAAPLVRVVKTDFKWEPTTKADQKLVDARAIYRRIIKTLENDSARINLIAETIAAQPPESAQLVLCKRLEYLSAIAACLTFAGYDDPHRIFMMRGSESDAERIKIVAEANEGHCVILSTVANEGTDIPRLDRLHLTWPQRKELSVTQQVGRVLRHHHDKRGAIIFDYADLLQGTLRSQAYARFQTYRKLGIPIDGLGRMQ